MLPTRIRRVRPVRRPGREKSESAKGRRSATRRRVKMLAWRRGGLTRNTGRGKRITAAPAFAIPASINRRRATPTSMPLLRRGTPSPDPSPQHRRHAIVPTARPSDAVALSLYRRQTVASPPHRRSPSPPPRRRTWTSSVASRRFAKTNWPRRSWSPPRHPFASPARHMRPKLSRSSRGTGKLRNCDCIYGLRAAPVQQVRVYVFAVRSSPPNSLAPSF